MNTVRKANIKEPQAAKNFDAIAKVKIPELSARIITVPTPQNSKAPIITQQLQKRAMSLEWKVQGVFIIVEV